MFGKPEWFQEKKIGVGLKPVAWQGWMYTVAAALVIGAPFLMLLAGGRGPEAMIWLTAATGALVWDMRQVIASMHKPQAEEVFVINDETDISSLATRNFDLHLRN